MYICTYLCNIPFFHLNGKLFRKKYLKLLRSVKILKLLSHYKFYKNPEVYNSFPTFLRLTDKTNFEYQYLNSWKDRNQIFYMKGNTFKLHTFMKYLGLPVTVRSILHYSVLYQTRVFQRFKYILSVYLVNERMIP